MRAWSTVVRCGSWNDVIFYQNLSGFRCHRCTVDGVGALALSLQGSAAWVAQYVSPYLIITMLLTPFPSISYSNGQCEVLFVARLLHTLRYFLVAGLCAKLGGVASSPRVISQVAPRGSVLSPLPFNIALAALPEYLHVLRFSTA